MPFTQTQPSVAGIDTSANSAVMIVRPTVLVDQFNNPITAFVAGELRVAQEPTQLFREDFDTATLDVTNRWKTPTASGGASAATGALGQTVLGTGTTANGYSHLESAQSFPPLNPGYMMFYCSINIAWPIVANQYFFWGLGTSPGSPTAAAPLTNAIGYEITTAGKLFAVSYQSGTRVAIADLSATGTNKQPTDANMHIYYLYFRDDRAYWCIDGADMVVASITTGTSGPDVNVLPIKFSAIAGAVAPLSSGLLTVDTVAIGDTGRNSLQLADGTFPWRKVLVDINGNLAVRGGSQEQAGLTASALNADLQASLDVSAFKWWSLHVTAIAAGGTLTFQASNDGVNFVSVSASNVATLGAPAATTSATGLLYGICAFRYMRIRQTAWTSGSTTGVLEYYTSATDFIPSTLSAVQSGIWTVQPGNTANTTPWFANAVGTTGGLSTFRLIAAGTTNATSVKASAGQIYGYHIYNAAASVRFVKLYNKASAPTVGTDVPNRTIAIAPAVSHSENFTNGLNYNLGIALATTTVMADADATAVTASDLSMNIDYK